MQWGFVAACLTGLQAINDFTHYTGLGKSCLVKWDSFNKLLLTVLIVLRMWKFIVLDLCAGEKESDQRKKWANNGKVLNDRTVGLPWLDMCRWVWVFFPICCWFFFLLEIGGINPCSYLLTFKNEFESASDLLVFCFPRTVKKKTEK